MGTAKATAPTRLGARFVFAALLATAGAACEGSSTEGAPADRAAVEIVADNEHEPYGIVVGKRFAYWLTRDAIRAASLDGGPARTVHESTTLHALVVAGEELFYADHGQRVIGRIRGVDGTMREALVEDVNAGALAIADGYLYWTQATPDDVIRSGERQGTIARVALSGGEPEVVAEDLEDPFSLAATPEAVFFSSGSGDGTYRLSLTGDVPERIAGWSSVNFAADEDGVFLVQGDLLPTSLDRVSNDGPRVTLIDEMWSFAKLAVDATGVYLLSDSGRLSRTAHEGGKLVTLATDFGYGQLALADGAVYLALPESGQVLRVDKRGTDGADQLVGSCPEPIGSADDLASTPRAEPEIELLALRLDGDFVASQTTYDRLVADLTAIRHALPKVPVTYRAPHDGKTFHLSVTEPAAMAIEAGDYHTWDCLNDHYGLQDVVVDYSWLTDAWSVTITLEGLYDMPEIAKLYAMLPGVKEAGTFGGVGDGPTTCVERRGERYEYVVDDRGGDCPAGCTTTTAYLFVSTERGVVEAQGKWSSQDGERPAWHEICADF